MKNCAQLQKWIFYLFIQNPKCASHSKWCHQMLQNDVIKCCKMMSPHSNEPATWRNCVSCRHFCNIHRRTYNHFPEKQAPEEARNFVSGWNVLQCIVSAWIGLHFDCNVTERMADSLEYILACQICLEDFEEAGDHLPRILPCSHSLCEKMSDPIDTRKVC